MIDLSKISQKWINVKDELPKKRGRYIVYGIPTCGSCRNDWEVMEANWRDKEKYFEFGEYDCGIDVTHWMPLPEAPLDCQNTSSPSL